MLGPNEVGKSTIVNLLLGFYQPQSGLVSIGTVGLNKCSLNIHRRQIGVVFQDQKFISGTIEENIVYGLDDYTQEELLNAAEISGVT